MARGCCPKATLREFGTEDLKKKEKMTESMKSLLCFFKCYDLIDSMCGPVADGDFISADVRWLDLAAAPGCPLRHKNITVQIPADEEVLALAFVELAPVRSAQSHPCQGDS